MCSNDLVFTKSVLLELPIAIPLRSELASGCRFLYFAFHHYIVFPLFLSASHFFVLRHFEVSYWTVHAKRNNGFTIDTMIEDYDFPEIPTAAEEISTCDIKQIQLQVVQNGDKYQQIDINQMALPFLFFALCIFVATIFHLGKLLVDCIGYL